MDALIIFFGLQGFRCCITVLLPHLGMSSQGVTVFPLLFLAL